MSEIYIGTLSGTSADAIDSAAFRFGLSDTPIEFLGGHSEPLPDRFKEAIQQFQTQSLSAYKLAQLDAELGRLFADAINSLIDSTKLNRSDIRAIGCHGQTMMHKPNNVPPFTVQIANPHIIAAETGIDTVADFRRSDMALGGQGAPLTPAFHQAYLARTGKEQAILNIGGICNITFLSGKDNIAGFDCGPGNTLLDYWIKKNLQLPYDNRGEWATQEKYDPDLLESFKQNEFLSRESQKSACTSDFSHLWLEKKIAALKQPLNAAVVQATLTELTASCVVDAITNYNQTLHNIFVYGGGVRNLFLIKRIETLSGYTLETTRTLGIDSEWVEAATFAWLAKQKLENKPANIPAITGAKKNIPLGVVYTA